MRYSNIIYNDVVNGEGMRISLFVQGCSHKCKGCFNDSTHDFNGGKLFSKHNVDEIMFALKHYAMGYDGISILGGEPFDNVDVCNMLVNEFRKEFSNTMNIWIWSGYTLEQLLSHNSKFELLKKCDVLVDGKFIEDLSDPELLYRGSSNQRILDIQDSIYNGLAVPYKLLNKK